MRSKRDDINPRSRTSSLEEAHASYAHEARLVELAIQALRSQLGRLPSDAEIANELGLALSAYWQLLEKLRVLALGKANFDRPLDQVVQERVYVAGNRQDDHAFPGLDKGMCSRVAEAIEQLPEPERLVLTLYYHENMNAKEIGFLLEAEESVVWRLWTSASLYLRAMLLKPSPGQRLSGAPE